MRVLRHAGTAAYGDLRFTTAMRLPLVAGPVDDFGTRSAASGRWTTGAELI